MPTNQHPPTDSSHSSIQAVVAAEQAKAELHQARPSVTQVKENRMTTPSVSPNPRKVKALAMLGQGLIPTNTNGPLWEVPSQTEPDRTYIVHTETWTCSCPDSHNGCKHKHAVEIWDAAIQSAKAIAAKHSMSHAQVAANILSDLNSGVPKDKADRLQVLWRAAEHLADIDRRNGKANELIFHVVYRVAGRVIDSVMKVERVFEDGKMRQIRQIDDSPQAQLDATYRWLQANGYQPTGHHWIGDTRGHIRTRAEKFTLQATA